MSAERRIFPDYKPLTRPKRSASRLPWFAAGLGIPLLAFGLIGPRNNEPLQAPELTAESAALATPAGSANEAGLEPAPTGPAGPAQTADTAATGTALVGAPATANLGQPAPAGTNVVLKIRRGDSLDRLFARNDLSRADLAALITTDLGRKHLRLVRPGDEITVRLMDLHLSEKRLSFPATTLGHRPIDAVIHFALEDEVVITLSRSLH